MENEFKKRQMKRRGKGPSPSPDGFDSTDMYATMLNNPEFPNILMTLLAQKGLDSGATETSAQLVELLKSNPELFRGFLPTAPEPDNIQDQFNSATLELQQSILDQTSALEAAHSSHMDLQSELAQHDFMSMEPQIHDDIMTAQQNMLHSLPTPAPIPRIGIKTEDTTSSVQPPTPVPPPILPSIPSPVQTAAPAPVQPRPSQDRIRALGFPPLPSR